MATAGSWRISGSVTGNASGTRAVDVSITAPVAAVDSSITMTINGFSAVVVPTGATAMLIIPPSANTNAITLKGVTGDTGVAISKVYPTCVALGTTPSVGILTGASTIIQLVFM